MTIMKNHTQFDPASRTGTATPANAGAGPGGAAATFNNDDGQEVTIVNYDNNKDLELDLDLDFENQDGAEDNGNGAALSLKRKSRNSLLKKGLAVSCGFAVVAAAFVIGAEWTTSTMMSKSSVLEPAQAEYVSGRDRSSKSSKTCKALKGEPNGRCGKWDIKIKFICAGTKIYIALGGSCGKACCLVNYCNGNCGTKFPTCGKAFTTTARYLEVETMTAVAAEDEEDVDLDALLAELEIDDADVKKAIREFIESTDFSTTTAEDFIIDLLSKAKVDMTALEEEEAMFIDNAISGESDRPSNIGVCFKPF